MSRVYVVILLKLTVIDLATAIRDPKVVLCITDQLLRSCHTTSPENVYH